MCEVATHLFSFLWANLYGVHTNRSSVLFSLSFENVCFATNLCVVVCLFVCSIHSSALKSFGFHRQASCAPVQFRRRRNRFESGLLEQSSSCNFDLSQKNASSSMEDLEINNPLKCSLDSSYVFHLNSWNLQTDHWVDAWNVLEDQEFEFVTANHLLLKIKICWLHPGTWIIHDRKELEATLRNISKFEQ